MRIHGRMLQPPCLRSAGTVVSRGSPGKWPRLELWRRWQMAEAGCELDPGGAGAGSSRELRGRLSSSWCSTFPGRVRPPGCSANPKHSPIWFWEGRAPARPGSCRGAVIELVLDVPRGLDVPGESNPGV